MGEEGSESGGGGVADLLPFSHPTAPLILLFVVGAVGWEEGSESGGRGVADLLPFSHPTAPLILLFVVGAVVGLVLALRNCCTKQLLPHHLQKRLARGGVGRMLHRGKRKKVVDEESVPFIPRQEEKPKV